MSMLRIVMDGEFLQYNVFGDLHLSANNVDSLNLLSYIMAIMLTLGMRLEL
jgi:hypothetical protein